MYRPTKLSEYIGQEVISGQAQTLIEASIKKKAMLPHILISGPSGTGKTTLALILGKALGAEVAVITPSSIPTNEELFKLFAKTMADGKKPVIFIDEIHKLAEGVAEDLYLPMEDYVFVQKGPMEQQYDLVPWTLIGATTNPGLLPEPLINRFGIQFQTEPYTENEVETILEQAAKKSKIPFEKGSLKNVARRSRSNPRIANNLLERCYDHTLVHGNGTVSEKTVTDCFVNMRIDAFGLTNNDRMYMKALFDAGRSVGLDSLVPILHTDKKTIATTIEPFLVEKGFLTLSARGRQLTGLGTNYINLLFYGQNNGMKQREALN